MEIIADFASIIHAYFPGEATYRILPLGEGNINDTYRVSLKKQSFLLQKINKSVFKAPEVLLENHRLVYRHLEEQLEHLLLPELLETSTGALAYVDEKGQYWRMLTFLEGTHSVESVTEVSQVKTAAHEIGRFLAALNWKVPPSISIVIKDFHHLQKRYKSFLSHLNKIDLLRKQEAAKEIDFLNHWAPKMPNYHSLNLPQRLVHNDPKIGNVLFDEAQRVVAVIDWDTIMPGSLLTDFGDMVRTMVPSVGENEADLDAVRINPTYFSAICESFLPPLLPILGPLEKQYFATGPQYIVLEQMLRFLQDYLLGDVYYKTQYPKHNLVRARNQQRLFQILKDQETSLAAEIQQYFS